MMFFKKVKKVSTNNSSQIIKNLIPWKESHTCHSYRFGNVEIIKTKYYSSDSEWLPFFIECGNMPFVILYTVTHPAYSSSNERFANICEGIYDQMNLKSDYIEFFCDDGHINLAVSININGLNSNDLLGIIEFLNNKTKQFRSRLENFGYYI